MTDDNVNPTSNTTIPVEPPPEPIVPNEKEGVSSPATEFVNQILSTPPAIKEPPLIPYQTPKNGKPKNKYPIGIIIGLILFLGIGATGTYFITKQGNLADKRGFARELCRDEGCSRGYSCKKRGTSYGCIATGITAAPTNNPQDNAINTPTTTQADPCEKMSGASSEVCELLIATNPPANPPCSYAKKGSEKWRECVLNFNNISKQCADGEIFIAQRFRCETKPGINCATVLQGAALNQNGTGFDIGDQLYSMGCRVYHYSCPWNTNPGNKSCDDTGNGSLVGEGRSASFNQNCGTEQIDIECPANVCSGTIHVANQASTTYKKLWVNKYNSVACVNERGDDVPTPTSPPVPICTNIKVYKNAVQVAPSTLLPEDTVTIAVLGTGNPTQARFRINGAQIAGDTDTDPNWTTTTTKNASNEYYVSYTIPTGVTTFLFEGETFAAGAWH